MTLDVRKAIVIATGATILFFIMKRVWPATPPAAKKTDSSTGTASASGSSFTASPEQQKNALIVKTAYTAAMKDGKPESFLQEMNKEFYKEFKLRVYKRKGAGELIVTDEQGNEIK